ncbi:hypothetical protein PIB30_069407, partial [Stylosanthes scabra]|nr:hypothetical protein [Stylosanthes scabra]
CLAIGEALGPFEEDVHSPIPQLHRSWRSSPTLHYSPNRSSSIRVSPSSPTKATTNLYRHMARKSVKPPMRWELIPPYEGWISEEIRRMRKPIREKTLWEMDELERKKKREI